MPGLNIVIPTIQYHPDRPGGASRLAFEEACYLVERGHTVWFVASTRAGDHPEYEEQHGLRLLFYSVPRFAAFDPRRMLAHQSRVRQLVQCYIGSRVDLIHGHAPLQYAGALAGLAGSVRRCYSVHSPVRLEMQAAGRGAGRLERLRLALTGLLAHRIEHRCLLASDLVTSDSDYTRTLLRSSHGQAVFSKTRVVPGWVDLARFKLSADRQADRRLLNWPTNVPVLFTLRRLVPRMGLDRLLHAAQILHKAGHAFYLVIAGQGPLLAELVTVSQALGLADRVSFPGHVPEASLPLMYGAADAFVLPTIDLECFGMIAVEALACGTPVLATPVGAIPEIVARVEPRWLAEAATVTALADLLKRFLLGALPSHAPDALRQVVRAHYARDKVLAELTAAVLDTPTERTLLMAAPTNQKPAA
jgi:glycosyltransferase involved in cell wall biosynthesis